MKIQGVMNEYYYMDADSKQQGPLNASQLGEKGISASTLIWASGMKDWARADSVSELLFLFDTGHTPPPIPNKSYPDHIPSSASTLIQQEQAKRYESNVYDNRPEQTYDQYDSQHMFTDSPPIANPQRWLAVCIILTIFACSPFAIVGIILSIYAQKFYKQNDYARCAQYVSYIKILCILTAIWGFWALPRSIFSIFDLIFGIGGTT